MKTVGIITYHNYNNYGTMLQALALQQKIESYGYEAELIDYKKSRSISNSRGFLLRLKRLPVYILKFKRYFILAANQSRSEQKSRCFSEFYRKYLKVGNQSYCSDLELCNNPPVYDGYVVGSDQTWSPYVAGRPEAFYLSFVADDKKKGSYAPSLAVSSLTQEQQDFLYRHLVSFAFVSAREQTGAVLLENILKHKVEHVLDPTMLLTLEEWDKFDSHKYDGRKYVLVYLLGEKKEHRVIVKHIAKAMNVEVICMPVTYMELANKEFNKVFCGPDDFISLIRNAELICTDSFHGTAFSINFKKQFYSFCKNDSKSISSENSRLIDMLRMFGLESRLLTSIPEEIKEINYDVVDMLVKRKRLSSLQYLDNMLKTITG